MEISKNSKFYKVDETELFNKVHKYTCSRFKKFTNLHDIMTAEDAAQGILTWLYQTTRKGNRRVDELGLDGEAHFWNLINTMITTYLCCEVRAKNRRIQASSLDFDYCGDSDNNLSVLNIIAEDNDADDIITLDELVMLVPNTQINNLMFIGNYKNIREEDLRALTLEEYNNLYLLPLTYRDLAKMMLYYDEPMILQVKDEELKIKDPVLKALKQIIFKSSKKLDKPSYSKLNLKEVQAIAEDLRKYIAINADNFNIGGEIDETLWRQYSC